MIAWALACTFAALLLGGAIALIVWLVRCVRELETALTDPYPRHPRRTGGRT